MRDTPVFRPLEPLSVTLPGNAVTGVSPRVVTGNTLFGRVFFQTVTRFSAIFRPLSRACVRITLGVSVRNSCYLFNILNQINMFTVTNRGNEAVTPVFPRFRGWRMS